MINSFNTNSIDFLFVELQTGLTFADIALSAESFETDKISGSIRQMRGKHMTVFSTSVTE